MHHYYHEVPGRVRVKCPNLKGDQGLCRTAEAVLGREAGIERVSANPVTGSIIINYNAKAATSKQVLELLTRHGYFHPARVVTIEQKLNKPVEQIGQAVSKAVVAAVVERMLAGSPLSLITALL